MTNFERIKAISIDELAEICEAIAENDVCLMGGTHSCSECKFADFCDVPAGDMKKWLNREVKTMKQKQYTFNFKGGPITVWAFNETEAKILAQAEAIKNGWDYTIL